MSERAGGSDRGARQAVRERLGAARLHARDPGRIGDRARRPQRRRQDDAAAPGDRPGQGDDRRRSRCSACRRATTQSECFRGSASSPRTTRCYRNLTVADTLTLGRKLNPRWDEQLAASRVERLGLRLDQKVGKLSGGQQAQVALTLALAKRPELLVLDEPVASLDPLARREFLNGVLEAVAEGGMTVILSSHIVSELERVCDHLVTLAAGRTQLAGPIEEIVASHRVLIGPRSDAAERRARPRRHPREPHRAADDAARASERARLRLAAGNSTRSTSKRSCLPTWATSRAPRCGAAPSSCGGGS